MNNSVSLTSLNQNGNKLCCICFAKSPVDIPLINCDHRQEFCNECIVQWLEMKKWDCPICRKVWYDKDCSDTSSQIGGTGTGHLSVSLESVSSSMLDEHHHHESHRSPVAYLGVLYPSSHSPSSSTRRQMYSALVCYLCSFFIVILVYTVLILLSKKFERKV